jgi:hypothetical protein
LANSPSRKNQTLFLTAIIQTLVVGFRAGASVACLLSDPIRQLHCKWQAAQRTGKAGRNGTRNGAWAGRLGRDEF